MSMTQDKPRRLPMVPGPAGTHATPSLRKEPEPPGPLANRIPDPRGPVGNIAGAIAGVMAQVGTIPKGGYNAFHRYHYARMEDLLQVLTPLMGKQGLAVIQNEIEIKTVENRIAVTYEFSLFHESGQVWPEKPRFTGMCIARNSKGDFDDKALNKCHTAARKYFLLSLFQVPAGDFDEPDAEDANRPRERGAVPGPKTDGAKPAAATQVSQEGTPHKITLGQGAGADQWGSAFIRNIGKAKTIEEVAAWEKLNDATLQMLSENYPTVYDMLVTAVNRRLNDLGPTPAGMPDPKADPQEAMNWIAGQLQTFNTYEAAETFWNQIVAPRQADFDAVDWGMLMEEWQRTEMRLHAPVEEGSE